MLKQRILAAIAALPLLIYVIFYGGIPFKIFIFALAFLMALELANIFESRIKSWLVTDSIFLIIAVVLVLVQGMEFIPSYPIHMLVPVTLLSGMAILWSPAKLHDAIPRMSGIIMGACYIGLTLPYLWLLRKHAGAPIWVFFVFACTWASDTGAYFAGKGFGRTKLSPNISPKKTVEGFLGGLVFSIGVAFILPLIPQLIGELSITSMQKLWVGIFVAIFGALGDLTESILKRSAKVKDSSNLIPGHGGFLDRFDAILFVGPITYAFWYSIAHQVG